MKKEKVYDSDIGNKANTPFAKQLRDLISDAKTANALRDYLGVSIQAINQYKQGTAYPKTENLIKIADYFGVSVDYLLGRTRVQSMDADIQNACNCAGISEKALKSLQKLTKGKAEAINAILTSPNFGKFVEYIVKSAHYADNRGILIAKDILARLKGEESPFPAEDLENFFKYGASEASRELFEEVSSYLYRIGRK